MSDDQESPAGLSGIAVAAVGLCCGLPLLLGAGVAVRALGAVLGSILVVAVGSAAAVWAWRRRRRRAATCDTGDRGVRATGVALDADAAAERGRQRDDVVDGR